MSPIYCIMNGHIAHTEDTPHSNLDISVARWNVVLLKFELFEEVFQ